MEEVMKEIEVIPSWSNDMLADTVKQAFSEGRAVQFYASCVGLKDMARSIDPTAQVWYTERNGDPIAMLCPAGTPSEALPSVAMEYVAFEWVDPDCDFGTGVVVANKP
jgi:hypothetical protein